MSPDPKIPLPTIMRISGHKTITMLLRYFHLFGTRVREAASHLEVELHDVLLAFEVDVNVKTTPESHVIARNESAARILTNQTVALKQ